MKPSFAIGRALWPGWFAFLSLSVALLGGCHPVAPVPASITTQPGNLTVQAGGSATFTVIAAGTAPLAYQWQRQDPAAAGFDDVAGASEQSYTLANAALALSGAQFRVRVGNAVLPAGVLSLPAVLTVTPQSVAPAIGAQPQDQTVVAGAEASFSVTATGSAPLTYQWQRAEKGGASFADVPAAASSALSFTAAAGDDGARFRVRVSNGVGEVVSGAAALAVTVPPVITAQPQDQSVVAGAGASFSVTATGSAPLQYQWQRQDAAAGAGFGDIAGASGASYTLAVAQAGDTGAQLRVRVSNAALPGGVQSRAATLTVSPPVSVAVAPGAAVVLSDATLQLAATVTGATDTSVTWSVQEPAGGTVSDTGLYRAPAAAGTFHAAATSVADPSKSASAEIRVERVQVAVTPSPASLLAGTTLQLTAAVTGTADTSVTWSVAEGGGGAVDGAGLYSAPALGGTFHLAATSVADPRRSATVEVTVRPGSCSDGVRNQAETGVDCGGTCGATCQVGSACGAAGDCLFGSCAAGTCLAPSAGPTPTGPVTATIPPEGATLAAVTAERVSVSLTFPPGAVAAPLQVTLTPLPLTGAGWFRVAVSPAGTVLDQPATLQAVLPDLTPASAAADGILRFDSEPGGADASVLGTNSTGATLQASIRALGLPPFLTSPPSGGAPRPRGGGTLPTHASLLPSPAAILQGLPMNLATRIAIADNLMTVFQLTHRYRDAVELAGLIISILERMGDPASEGQIRRFVDRAWTLSCSGLADALSNVRADKAGGGPFCVAEARKFERPVMVWVLLLTKMNGLAPGACAGFSDNSYIDEVLGPYLAKAEKNVEVDNSFNRTLKCDCQTTPVEEWTRVMSGGACRAVGVGLRRWDGPQPFAAAAPSYIPTTDQEWDHFIDTEVRAAQMVVESAYLGVDQAASSEQTQIADPYLKFARAVTYAGCSRDATSQPVSKLLAAFPGNSGIQADGQTCATLLNAQTFGADGSALAQLSPPLGGATPTDVQRSGSVRAAKDGKLRLTGPIAALYCPAANTGGTEALALKLDGTLLQTLQSPPYLRNLFEIDLASALEAAHPGATTRLSRASVTVERTGDPCGGFWGSAPSPLLAVGLELIDAKIAFTRGTTLYLMQADGSGVTPLPIAVPVYSPSWSPDRTQLAFWRQGNLGYEVDAVNSDGSGLHRVSIPVPVLYYPEGFTQEVSPSWSPDGTRIACVSYHYNPGSIALMNADGTGLARLTTPTAVLGDGNPTWSPDGARIAFTRNSDQGPSQISVIGIDGSGLTALTSGPGFSSQATWSPDGAWIAFANDQGGNSQIYRMRADGTAVTRLTVDAATDTAPVWSVDGSRIAFLSDRSGTFQVHAMNVDGSGVVQLTTGAPVDGLAWR